MTATYKPPRYLGSGKRARIANAVSMVLAVAAFSLVLYALITM